MKNIIAKIHALWELEELKDILEDDEEANQLYLEDEKAYKAYVKEKVEAILQKYEEEK